MGEDWNSSSVWWLIDQNSADWLQQILGTRSFTLQAKWMRWIMGEDWNSWSVSWLMATHLWAFVYYYYPPGIMKEIFDARTLEQPNSQLSDSHILLVSWFNAPFWLIVFCLLSLCRNARNWLCNRIKIARQAAHCLLRFHDISRIFCRPDGNNW